jgi:GNAT superfamily N-acetyltransferase
MKVVDLDEGNRELYFVCLEDWSETMKEAGNHKSKWFDEMKDKGLRVKLALEDDGEVGGMIEYMPIEHSFAEGTDLHFINCIWVHGYDKGRGNCQGKGMGSALLKAAEEDARSLGSRGIAAWGIEMPFWMNAMWFEKHGYERTDSSRGSVLLWKRFSEDAQAPKWIEKTFEPSLAEGKVTVTSLFNGQCPSACITHERAKRAAAEFGEGVSFKGIDTSRKDVMREYGRVHALFIDDEEVETGPPPSYEDIKKNIESKVRGL